MTHRFTVGTLFGICLVLMVVHFSGYYTPEALNTHALKRAVNDQAVRNELQYNITSLFINYENALDDSISAPTTQNRNRFFKLSQDLDQLLDSASMTFGLNVRRQVNLFKAWQYQLNNAPTLQGKIKLQQQFLSHNDAINKSLTTAMQDFNNKLLYTLLHNVNYGMKKIPRSVQSEMNKVYIQSEPLIPAAVLSLKNRSTIMSCVPPNEDLKNPKKLANMIAALQYYSRYCAFLVQASTEFCNTITTLLVLKDNENDIAQTLAACQFAGQRLDIERQDALQKYGAYSYDAYINKFVVPLIPQYIAQLKNQVNSKSLRIRTEVCMLDNLPVVDFRNPDVDAQVFAFEQAGPSLCKTTLYELNRS
jgi:hypothetical protein